MYTPAASLTRRVSIDALGELRNALHVRQWALRIKQSLFMPAAHTGLDTSDVSHPQWCSAKKQEGMRGNAAQSNCSLSTVSVSLRKAIKAPFFVTGTTLCHPSKSLRAESELQVKGKEQTP
jgi:hypothetical protein